MTATIHRLEDYRRKRDPAAAATWFALFAAAIALWATVFVVACSVVLS